jgi:catechol 2,3-dioxygenase-like lactoylglutathione lyase family enzyme
MRPGNAAVLHHGKVWVRPAGSTWMKDAVPGEAYENETQRDIIGRNSPEEGNDILGKFNPGLGPQRFDQEGAAKFVPKGSDLVYEIRNVAPLVGIRLKHDSPDWIQYVGAGATFSYVEGEPTENVHLAFPASDDATVAAFHEAAVGAGFTDNGPPGERPHYHPGYVGAFVLDPNGNNIEVVCHHR